MAGLNNLISDTTTKSTTLPTWMDQAQQNVVNMATTGAGQVPQLQNTVAGRAINTYGGESNPFSQAQNTLSSIASGAANPWIVTPTYSQPSQPRVGSNLNNLPQMSGPLGGVSSQVSGASPFTPDKMQAMRANLGVMGGGYDQQGSPVDGNGNPINSSARQGTFQNAMSIFGGTPGLAMGNNVTAQTQPSSEYSPFAAMQPADDFGGGRAGTMSARMDDGFGGNIGMDQHGSGMDTGFSGINGVMDQQPSQQGQPTGYNVAPNPNTALGGLFAAQNQQLKQIMPQFTAPVDAASIGSGNFGGLRGETAYNKAIADAQANLFAQQNQAALQNQQTGVNAATGMGNIGAQDIAGAGTLTNLQQTAPLSAAANVSKIIGGLSAPTSVTSSTQLSPLSQIGSLTSALGGGTNAVNSLLNTIKPGTDIASLLSGLFTSNPLSGTNMTGTGGMGDSGASQQYLSNGSLNPNYDVYADPNATQDMIDAQNAANQTGSGIASSEII